MNLRDIFFNMSLDKQNKTVMPRHLDGNCCCLIGLLHCEHCRRKESCECGDCRKYYRLKKGKIV